MSGRRKKRVAVWIALLAVLLAGLWRLAGDHLPVGQNGSDAPAVSDGSQLTAEFLDVGQGDCSLFILPDGKTLLIDAGNRADGDEIADYLKGKGIGRIDYLIATHPHADHIGGMRAVIKLDAAQVENLAAQAGEDCWPVNYNSPQQTVVAGAPDALQTLDVLVKEAGGRAMKVAVSGAFHSPYMAEATEGLATYIQAGHAPSPLLIPVMANMTAAPYPADPRAASDVLANQVSHAVRWVDTLHALQDQGIDTFIEVGPGKTLSGLVKRTLSDVRVYLCETAEQVAAIADELA